MEKVFEGLQVGEITKGRDEERAKVEPGSPTSRDLVGRRK